MKKLILALVLGFCSLALADPAPFGLELNKATFKEVTKKYPKYLLDETPSYLNGKSILVEANKFDLEGIEGYVTLSFDSKNILQMVGFIMAKEQFDSVYTSLKKKYKMIGDNLYSADKSAYFEDGNSKIIIVSFKSEATMSVAYMTNKFKEAGQNQGRIKQQKQDSLL